MIKKINRIIFLLIIISFNFCRPLSAEVIDRIVAIVNNEIITLVQLNKNTSMYLKNIKSSGYSDEKKKQMTREINEKILNDMVDRSLTQQEAKKYHIIVSDGEINSTVENAKTSRSMSQEEFEQCGSAMINAAMATVFQGADDETCNRLYSFF